MTWSGIELPAGLTDPGQKAPMRFPRMETASFRRALSSLFETPGVPEGTFSAALSSGCALLEGAQELVALSNRIVSPATPFEVVREAVRQVHLELGALLKHRNAAYSLHQVAGLLATLPGRPPGGAAMPRLPRLKDFMTPLETSLERLGIPETMDAERRGPLLVHWDELYDDASLLLARFFHLVGLDEEAARALAPDFLRRAYVEFAKDSLADHVLATHDKDATHDKGTAPGKGTGLLDLLGELGRALESL